MGVSMKIKFQITTEDGTPLLLGAETELKELVINGVQIVKDETLHIADTTVDVNPSMRLINNEDEGENMH
jgi:hypothetical protein|tara:strand:+ start:755 stop:964 length:210 start_codon:yes stop_codon:yes gene_type:complete